MAAGGRRDRGRPPLPHRTGLRPPAVRDVHRAGGARSGASGDPDPPPLGGEHLQPALGALPLRARARGGDRTLQAPDPMAAPAAARTAGLTHERMSNFRLIMPSANSPEAGYRYFPRCPRRRPQDVVVGPPTPEGALVPAPAPATGWPAGRPPPAPRRRRRR